MVIIVYLILTNLVNIFPAREGQALVQNVATTTVSTTTTVIATTVIAFNVVCFAVFAAIFVRYRWQKRKEGDKVPLEGTGNRGFLSDALSRSTLSILSSKTPSDRGDTCSVTSIAS